MASNNNSEEDLLESLRNPRSEKLDQQAKELKEREAAQNAKAAERLRDLISSNSTLPVTISSINLIGAAPQHTRRSFLDGLFKPILSANRDAPYTLAEALQEAGNVADKLRRFEIYHNVSMLIDRPLPTVPSSTPSDIAIYLHARERGRINLKTGTDVGNVEGSAYGNLLWRNIFGGAESLSLNASRGTRTRSSYQAIFDTPIVSDPDKRITVDALQSSTSKPWASHEEVLKGAGVKYSWATGGGSRHEVAYSGVWRQITNLDAGASPTVRGDAGDSVKSSISHTWTTDKRDHPLLPSRGYLLKTVSEIAGWGPLRGDVAFWKSEIETNTAVSLPLRGWSFSSGFRAGMLYPLPVGFGGAPKPSRINDRFQLGGPTDIRGFNIGGLGPHDGKDGVGGDVYAAFSSNLLIPFPRVGAETPLRLQLFANGGRSLALKDKGGNTSSSVYSTIAGIGDGLPSIAAGVGVVYAHPIARFELNFSVPVVKREGEDARKGVQFGVGINFM